MADEKVFAGRVNDKVSDLSISLQEAVGQSPETSAQMRASIAAFREGELIESAKLGATASVASTGEMIAAAGKRISDGYRAVGRLTMGEKGEELSHQALSALLHGNVKESMELSDRSAKAAIARITGGEEVASHGGLPQTPAAQKSTDGLKI